MAYHEPARADLPAKLEIIILKLRAGEIPAVVTPNFQDAHPVTLLLKADLEATTPRHFGQMRGYSGCFVDWSIRGRKDWLTKALLLMDTLFRTLEAVGCQVGVDKEAHRKPPLFVQVGWGRVRVKLFEQSIQPSPSRRSSAHRPSPARMVFIIDDPQPPRARKVWQDTARNPLEKNLCSIAARLLEAGQISDAAARVMEKERQVYAIECQRRYELEQRQREENGRRRALEDMADAWAKSQQLELFVAKCEEQLKRSGELDPADDPAQWLVWAKEHARRLNPLRGDIIAQHRELARSSEYMHTNRNYTRLP